MVELGILLWIAVGVSYVGLWFVNRGGLTVADLIIVFAVSWLWPAFLLAEHLNQKRRIYIARKRR